MPHLHVLVYKGLPMQTSRASALSVFTSAALLFNVSHLISCQQSFSIVCRDKQPDKINMRFASMLKIVPSSENLTLKILSLTPNLPNRKRQNGIHVEEH